MIKGSGFHYNESKNNEIVLLGPRKVSVWKSVIARFYTTGKHILL